MDRAFLKKAVVVGLIIAIPGAGVVFFIKKVIDEFERDSFRKHIRKNYGNRVEDNYGE